MRRTLLIWACVVVAVTVPVIVAAFSPYLAFRQPVYIIAGFAGIIGLALMPFQPLLAARRLPGLSDYGARRLHRWIGVTLVSAVVVHVAGLWITSPPDVVDALLFVSPTPFSAWGVTAMWAIFAAALFVALRKRLRLRWQVWRRVHAALAVVAVLGTVVHALLIEGAMETATKIALCVGVVGVTVWALAGLKIWSGRAPRRSP